MSCFYWGSLLFNDVFYLLRNLGTVCSACSLYILVCGEMFLLVEWSLHDSAKIQVLRCRVLVLCSESGISCHILVR